MNTYLRQLNLYDELIEKNIYKLWNLIKNAPIFDKSYKLYRFIKNDEHLQYLKEGDYLIHDSFISTTRDPFYSNDEFSFGFILVMIKIPANKKGIGLCMETYSNFKKEQEIILPPLTKLKLLKTNKNVKYFHINNNFKENIITKYEFEYISSEPIKIKNILNKPTNVLLDLYNIPQIKLNTFFDKTKLFVKNYTNENYQFQIKLNNKLYTFVCEWYNSSDAYEPYYFIKTNNGFHIYCQNPDTSNYSFIMEFDENQAHINYYSQYSYSDNYFQINNYETIKFITYFAYIFNINNIYIHPDHGSCKDFFKNIDLFDMFNYNLDFYNYMTNKNKKFKNNNITAKFLYHQLDKLFTINANDILNINDRDELYQIHLNKNMSFGDFYLFILKNRPDLIKILENKSYRIFNKNNPFEQDYYILNGYSFLYDNNIINTFPKQKNIKDHTFIKHTIKKADYRIRNIK
jgi:hypothetical protein